MSIKRFVKEHCPKSLFPLLRTTWNAVKWPAHKLRTNTTVRRSLKYIPYYQDELSRYILMERMHYLEDEDRNHFLEIAEKSALTFPRLAKIPHETYSGIVLVYDRKESSLMRYSCRLLESSGWSGKYRLLSFKDFMNGSKISASEVLVPVLSPNNKDRLLEHISAVKPEYDVYIYRYENCPFGDTYEDTVTAFRSEKQYLEIFSPVDDEIVVDAGAYDGATAIQFLEWGKGKVKLVYSFEFDPQNAAKCEENLKPYSDKVILVKKGTWDKDETMHITTTGNSASSVTSEGDTEVYLTSIDSIVQDEHVTFIKMDVEGAELKSLMGAKNTIIKNHPRLAICAYHKPEDLYELPEYILSLVPEYKFMLRHYCSNRWETVLYAYCG